MYYDKTTGYFTFVIARRETYNDPLIAIVSGCLKNLDAPTDECKLSKYLRTAIFLAASDWMNSSATGKEAWLASVDNFNIGDLACYVGDEDLQQAFINHNILELDIDAHEVLPLDFWSYDSIIPKRLTIN